MNRIILGLMALLWMAPVWAAGVTELHVAPNGRDNWSGRLTVPTGSDGPLASMEGARDAVRLLKKAGLLQQPLTVWVHQGSYLLSHTLVFTAEDSGTPDCPITYRAMPGETVTLTGAQPVQGWKKYRGGIFVTGLAEQGIDDAHFRELFFRDSRQTLARYPKLDPEHPVTGGMLYVEDTGPLEKKSFTYKEGSIPFDRWKDISQAEVNIFPYNCWDHNIIRVGKVDQESQVITLRYNVAGTICTGNRYFIQNVLGALDSPGEWFSDWKTGQLYFYPPTNKAPAPGEVTVPVLEDIVEFSGTPDNPVEHLWFQGFTLKGARQDAITLEGARSCQLLGNTITQVGGVGINAGALRNALKGVGLPQRKTWLASVHVHSGDRELVFSHPCQDCRVAGNDIDSVGGEGVALFGNQNVADNNHVSRTGTYDRVSAGITLCGDGNVASHNTIHDVPRDAIFMNGKLNIAEYNDIRSAMLYTADNGAITLRQHDVSQAVKNVGNVIRYNRILDTIGYGSYPHCTHPGDGFASPFCSFGIYLDGSICGVKVYGNVIARCGGDSVFIQFGGDNSIENNIFVEGNRKRTQFDSMMFFGTFMFSDTQNRYRDNEPPNVIQHNIFDYSGPDTKLYQVGQWADSPEWNKKQAVFNENLVSRHGLPVNIWMHRTLDCRTLSDWQARGFDTRSVANDPYFIDPSNDDYRLRSDSPAYAVGFKDINAEISRIGAYRSDDRASWPLQNTFFKREKPLVFDWRKEPLQIADGFERRSVGSLPSTGTVVTEGAASVLVTDEAAKTGSHSLKFTDAPGLKNPWEPHLFYRPNFRSGPIHGSIDLMNSKDAPADLYIEWRDWDKDLFVGPTFRVTRDGRFFVNGRLGAGGNEIAHVPNGVWYRVSIDLKLGDSAPKEYRLTLSIPGKKDLVSTQPYADREFRNLNWLGISSLSTDHTVFYVDNILLGQPDSKKIREAWKSPSILGRPAPLLMAKSRLVWTDRLEWEFAGDGIDLPDKSGNGLTADLGGAARATGSFGTALYLDGSGGAMTVPDSSLLQFGKSSFSIECWLYPIMLDIAADARRRRVLEKTGYPSTWWNIDTLYDGRVSMEMADSDGKSGTTVSTGALRERSWTHLAIVVDRPSRKVSYFFNGKLDSVCEIPPDFTGDLNVAGKPLSTGTWQPFVGLIHDLRIYRRILVDGEPASDFDDTKSRHASNSFKVLIED